MTPQEKARELIAKFTIITVISAPYPNTGIVKIKGNEEEELRLAKHHALTAVDEIINTDALTVNVCGYTKLSIEHLPYWEKVRKELKKL